MGLRLSHLGSRRRSTPPSSSSAMVTVSAAPGSGGPSEKRKGRPPGSGKMQQLASLGCCCQDNVLLCIMSATGAVCTATLYQDASSGSVVTYEGQFEILCLSGSFLVIDDGGSRTRSGGPCIALCGPGRRVIGGSVGGVLTAAGTVQVVIVGSFLYVCGNKEKTEQEEETEEANGGGEEETPLMLQCPMMISHLIRWADGLASTSIRFGSSLLAHTDGWYDREPGAYHRVQEPCIRTKGSHSEL